MTCSPNRIRVCSLITAMIVSAPVTGAAQESKVITNSIGMQLARIPAGKLMLGSPESEPEREKQELLHEVAITRPFSMGVHEVTQGQFAEIMGVDKRWTAYFDSAHGGGPDHPMEFTTWESIHEFLKKLSQLPAEREAGRTYRLPTEAEWEYACRAGTTTPFHVGKSLSSSQANFNGTLALFGARQGPYLKSTAQVGSYPPNAFGLYDMHGNVGEICADWYWRDYYASSPVEDPQGPEEGASSDDFGNTYFVVRGGSWQDDARACRSAYRYRGMLENKYPQAGFRVVCELAADAAE